MVEVIIIILLPSSAPEPELPLKELLQMVTKEAAMMEKQPAVLVTPLDRAPLNRPERQRALQFTARSNTTATVDQTEYG
jgi:hypothetical protein